MDDAKANKKSQCNFEEAHGILRLEVTLRKQAIQDRTGNKRPTLRDISPRWLIEVLEGELEKLGLLNRSIGTRDTTLKLLCEKYGALPGVYYFGLLRLYWNFHRKKSLLKL